MSNKESSWQRADGPVQKRNLLLFRRATRTKALSRRPLSRTSALRMVRPRGEATSLSPSRVCFYTLQGTGITSYLKNGGRLEVAQYIAGYSDASTTKLCDRRQELVTKEEIDKIEF